ncbi:hypothetical protein BK132_19185 [Paenibacillus sp. FSL H8-0259]|nr:hypothetical protein BK132_19185 [Paenibacillus sp. FSL H8-0259]
MKEGNECFSFTIDQFSPDTGAQKSLKKILINYKRIECRRGVVFSLFHRQIRGLEGPVGLLTFQYMVVK